MHPAYAPRSPETVTSKVATASLPFYWPDSKPALCNRSTLYGHAKGTVNLRHTVLDTTRLLSSLPQLARCRLKALGWAQAPVGCSFFGANLTPVPYSVYPTDPQLRSFPLQRMMSIAQASGSLPAGTQPKRHARNSTIVHAGTQGPGSGTLVQSCPRYPKIWCNMLPRLLHSREFTWGRLGDF